MFSGPDQHGLNRSLKKSFLRPQFPSAAEAATDFAALAARLEAAPLQNMNETRVFPQPVQAVPSHKGFTCPPTRDL
jgi:hypothetical protein